MTVIIGYLDKENNQVYMAGDSRTSQDTYVDTWNDKKVWITGDFIIGVCGTLRLLNIIKYQFIPPLHPEGMSIEEYINSLFINEIQGTLIGFKLKDNENKKDVPGSILVGYKGRLFEIGCDLSVHESTRPFRCIGSGGQIAMGVLMAFDYMDCVNDYYNVNTECRLYDALQIVSKLDAGVGPPFYVLKI